MYVALRDWNESDWRTTENARLDAIKCFDSNLKSYSPLKINIKPKTGH